jgi:hypothetical protein
VSLFLASWFTLSGAVPGVARTVPRNTPSTNPWTILDPFDPGDTPANHRHALRKAGRFGNALSKGLFHRRTDTPIHRFLKNYRESFNTLNFSELYELEEVPWTKGQQGRKELYFEGLVQNGWYYLVHDTSLRQPSGTGESSHLISIQPRDRGFVLRNERWTNVGPLDEKTLHDVFYRFLRFFDFAERGLTRKDERLEAYDRFTKRSHPHLRDLLDRHLTVHSLGSVDRDSRGQKLNRVKIRVTLEKESFRGEYPELYEVIDDFLEPSGLRVTLKTPDGDRLMQHERDGLTWTGRFATRRGKLVPVDTETGEVTGPGRTPLEARKDGFKGTISSWIHLYGMRFGMEGFTFTGRYNDGNLAWRAAERPALDLPIGFNFILSPFVSPFLEYLENGENGNGISFREGFRETDEGVVRVEKLRLPLKNSAFLTFLMKLNSFTLQPFDEESEAELERFGQSVASAVRKDYRRELRQAEGQNN